MDISYDIRRKQIVDLPSKDESGLNYGLMIVYNYFMVSVFGWTRKAYNYKVTVL
jgi:hypothetical protein